MRKDSLIGLFILALIALPGCSTMFGGSSSTGKGLTTDQSAAMLPSGHRDALGNSQPSAWQRWTGAVTGSSLVQGISKPFQRDAQAGSASRAREVPADDPTSLAGKSNPANADTHVAMARLMESKGHMESAVQHYQQALAKQPDHLGALLGYGHLLDREGQLPPAAANYRRACQAHPNAASPHNDLGICLARMGRQPEALAPLRRAAALDPQKNLYRNNLASVLTDMGQTGEALAHLRAAHREPVAHYNLGHLLQQRGQTQMAADQFARAAALDPSFVAARQWATQLGAVAQRPAGSPVRTPPVVAQ